MIKSPASIIYSEGGQPAEVTAEAALLVSPLPAPAGEIPTTTLQARKPYRGLLENGASSPDMNVDGSVTPVEFAIDAEAGAVIWIRLLRLIIKGVNLEMDGLDFQRFGAATAAGTPLTNGVEIEMVQGAVTTALFPEAVKRMGELYDHAAESLNIKGAVSASESYLSFDIELDPPVALAAGSADRVLVRVSDDLTALASFRALAIGSRETT